MNARNLIAEDMNGGGVIRAMVDLGDAGISLTILIPDIKDQEQDIYDAIEKFEDNFNSLLTESKVHISLEEIIESEDSVILLIEEIDKVVEEAI